MNDTNNLGEPEPIRFTFYHPLCELNHDHLNYYSRNRILKRENTEIKIFKLTFKLFL